MKNYLLYIALLTTALSFGQIAIITEFHYSDFSTDANEGVEIAVQTASLDFTNWSIVIYNSDGTVSTTPGTISLSSFGTLTQGTYKWIGIADMPDELTTPPDGAIVLYDGSSVIDSWSYGGSFTATAGVANGITFTDVGITEDGATKSTTSLQLTDSGWLGDPTVAVLTATPDAAPVAGLTLPLDINQIPGFNMYPNPVVHGSLVITSPNNTSKQVEIYAITGSRVFAKSVRNNEIINVSNLSTGLYILKVYEEGKLATRKLLINN